MAVLHSCLVAGFASRHSHFLGDDIVGLYQSRKLPFLTYLATPIDVHFVPLHRLATYAMGRLAPANFVAAVLVLLSFHLAAVLFLYLSLEHLHPTWLNAVFASWYATHIYIGVLFTWWTSGLHRLPYVCLLSAGLYAFVKLRWRPRFSYWISVVLCFVFALGFFEKALLVPLILLGVDIVLCGGASRGARRAVASLFVALGAVAIGFVSLWRHAVGPEWSRIGGGASFLFTYFKLSWLMLARSACGRVNDGAPLFFAVLAVLVLSTVWRRPSSAVAWVIGAVVVSVCLEVTGMSVPRSRAWGFTLHLSHRYYPDVMFVLVVFTALACQRSLTLSPIREPPRLARGFGSGICAWPALGAALSVAVTSYRASTNDVAVLYTAQSQIRDYMRNIVKGLDPLRRRRTPPPFLEGHVPKYVSPLGGWIAEHSVYVEAMGVQARVVKNTRGSYRILPTGVIVFGGAPVAR